MPYYKITVRAGAKKETIRLAKHDRYRIEPRAPAVEGRANRSALRLLAQAVRQPIERLRIIKGARQPQKIVEVLARP